MSRVRTFFFVALIALLAAAPASLAAAASPTVPLFGAGAAAADRDLSIPEMLRYAIEDEYAARASYVAIMAKFGQMRPFSNIMQAEESHIAFLGEAYADAGLAVPADRAAALVSAPATLLAAFQAGQKAEIENIAMYDAFLASPALSGADAADLRALFVRLRDASKNHLRSFENQLARY